VYETHTIKRGTGEGEKGALSNSKKSRFEQTIKKRVPDLQNKEEGLATVWSHRRSVKSRFTKRSVGSKTDWGKPKQPW